VSGINRIIMSLHTIADVLYAPKGLISRCKLQKTGFSVLCFPIFVKIFEIYLMKQSL
jgi:hypothetical protein